MGGTEPWVRVAEGRVDGQALAAFGHSLGGAGGNCPDGPFAHWAATAASLELAGDRLGMWPLYYATGPGFAAASPSVPALLAAGASPALDLDALAVFIRLGFFLGEDTAFSSIRALPPAAKIAWTPGNGLLIESGRPAVRREMRSRSEAVAGYIELFRQAVARRLPEGPFVLPLSGGRDSRHILLELHRLKRLPELCITTRYYGDRPNEDARIAPLLARAAGAPWRRIEPRRSQLLAELAKNRITGYCADEHGWCLGLADFVARHGFRTIFDGLGGDMLSVCQFQTAKVLHLYRAGLLDDLVDELLGFWSPGESWFGAVLRPELHRALSVERARARLKRELASFVDHPNPVAAFYFWNRIRREIALYSLRILPPEVAVICPYLDAELVDFLISLPADIILDKTFHDETIATAYPAFADLPYEDKGVRSAGGGIYWRALAATQFLYGLAHMRSRYVDERRTLPALARAMLTGRGALLHGRGPVLLIYLPQLEAAAA
jgi:asparagine synthase (glutamine-hydrolysing)